MAKETTETALVVIEPTNALAVFTATDKVDPILAAIKKIVAEFTPDTTTAKGRDEIRAMAHKVARSKTYLDGIGKDLVDQYKEIPKKIDANRKRIRDELDALKDEVRKPLTDWEEAEKARVQGIKDRIETIRQHAGMSEDSAMTKAAIARLEAVAIDESFGEFAAEAAQAKDKALTTLRADLEYCLKREAEQAELKRLREEAAKREQEEREARIAQEAAEKATRDAEEKAAREKAKAEARELRAKLAQEQAEREAARAKAEAESKAQAAVEAERQRIADEQAKAEAEEAARQADDAHKFRIHGENLEDFQIAGADMNTAMRILDAIRDGEVRNLKIIY